MRAGYRSIAVATSTDRIEDAPPSTQGYLAALPQVAFDESWLATKDSRARALIVAGDLPGGRDRIREMGWQLENSRAELILVSRLTDVAGPRVHLRPVVGLPMVHVQLPQYTGVAHTVKRAFDVFASAAALLVLSPLLGVIALTVRLSDNGPGAVPAGARRASAARPSRCSSSARW